MSEIRVCKDFVQDDSFYIKVSHNPVVDQTTAVYELTLKAKETSGTPALYVSYDVAAAIVAAAPDTTIYDNAVLGIVNVPITREDTSAVQPGKYFASLKRTIGTETLTLVQSGINDAAKVEVYQTLTEKV